jgi:hypothetical protein
MGQCLPPHSITGNSAGLPPPSPCRVAGPYDESPREIRFNVFAKEGELSFFSFPVCEIIKNFEESPVYLGKLLFKTNKMCCQFLTKQRKNCFKNVDQCCKATFFFVLPGTEGGYFSFRCLPTRLQ